MKKLTILLTVLSCIMTAACSKEWEDLSKKVEPEQKNTTNVDTTTEEIQTCHIYFYDEPSDIAELPFWIIENARDLKWRYPDGLDVYRGNYLGDEIYIAMTANSKIPPISDRYGEPLWKKFWVWMYSTEWKRIFSWRPDVWNDSLEKAISAPDILKRTIYIPDELVDTTSLPAWTAREINHLTKELPIGLDFYRGEYRNDTIYMTMAIGYERPDFFDKNGKELINDDIYEKSTNWKRVYFWRPEGWDKTLEGYLYILYLFLR